jgi:Ca2+-binding EF-hand superfamily protein
MTKSQQEIKANQDADSLHRLYDLIYDNAHSLRLSFEKHAKQIDVSKQPQHVEALENFVTFKDWSNILQEILQVDLQWGLLSNYLLKPEQKINHENEEYIAYSKFLDRFQLKLDERLTEWQEDVVNSLVTNFVNSAKSVKDMFEEYDTNNDKKISYEEFWQGMLKMKLGEAITESQCYEIMASIDKDRNGYIDYNEWRNHFGPKFDRFKNASPWLKTTIAEISKKLVEKHKNIKQSFLTFDSDRDHRITYAEFSKILRRDLGGDSFTQEQRQEIFKYVDENGSGAISYKEFKTAFEGSNAEKFAKRQNFEISAKNTMMYQLCTIIRKSRTQLLNIWSEVDTSKEHLITQNEFIHALMAVNTQLKNNRDLQKIAIANEQMQKLYAIIDKHNEGCINYLQFLQMFEVRLT